MRCSVQNCYNDTKNTTKSHGITFHLFPKEPTLRAAWVEALALSSWEPKERSTVCSEHFKNEDFYRTKTGLRKIKNGAVPITVLDSTEDLEAPAALRELCCDVFLNGQVCRICLVMDTRMYHIRDSRLEHLYNQVTGIFFSIEDRLPQRLCWECAHRLKSAATFKSKALKAHELLTDMISSSSYITIRDIKSVNRTKNNLKSNLEINKIDHSHENNIIVCDSEIIKSESHNHDAHNDTENNDNVYNDNGNNDNGYENNGNHDTYNGYNDNGGTKEMDKTEIMPVEIKDEGNEIYFEEYVDHFESDDDKKLSEIYTDVAEKKTKVKEAKVKRKKEPVEKKVRVVKKRKGSLNRVKQNREEEDSTSLLDKYKTSEIKRRKNDGPDENLFTISTLTYEEQIAEIEKRQDSLMYKNALFKCTVCYRGFQVQDRYEAHLVRHSEQCGAFECFICKTRLKSGRALRKHLTAQHTEKFSCKGCPFVTRNRGVAREHEKWHSGTKYQCPHCPLTFEKLTTYMGHIRIKHVSDFVCPLCGYTFVSQKGIEVHKKKKHRLNDRNVELTGPYCELCNVKFVSEEAHSRHLNLSARHSSDTDPNRLRNDSQSMRAAGGRAPRPQRRHDGGGVTCEQCGIQLRDLRIYAQHFRRAHPDKNRTKYPAMKTPCMCEQCGRIFQSMALLKDHMWVHTGEKRFKCAHCPKSFTQKTNLVFHERVHSATRPSYECTLCGKNFAFYNNRRRHMFIHTGLKPFKCDTCGKCFTTAGEQRAHVDHVHLKKPWPRRARRHGAPGGCGPAPED